MSRAGILPGNDKSPYARRGLLVRTLYLMTAGLYWLMMRLSHRGGGVVVLCYHSVRAGQLRRFAWQMRHVAGHTTSIAAARQMPASGCAARVCITFDDGFAGVLKYALPAMQALGVPATLFAIPGGLGAAPGWAMPAGHPDRGELLAGRAELIAAARAGLCVIGSHTLSHARLPGLAGPQLFRELGISKATLEKLLNSEVTDLAFPYGEHDRASVEGALEVGYTRLFTLEPRVWRAADEGQLIGRFLASPEMWRSEFALTCAGAYAWLSGWRRLRRWLTALWRGRPFRHDGLEGSTCRHRPLARAGQDLC